jgi:S1-C subfamily serine protease
VKEFLSQRGVPWTEKYVDEDRGAAIEMIRRSGQQGVPVTVIGDEVIVGFDRARLERVLASMRASQASQPTSRKSLGAKVADAGRYALPGGTAVEGAYVGGVNSGSPAEAAGLKVGDVITSFDNKPIRSADDLARALASLPGSSARLSVARGPSTREVVVQL